MQLADAIDTVGKLHRSFGLQKAQASGDKEQMNLTLGVLRTDF